ncbi:MAG: UbiH/UbiF/VisC/COQ6 family ubiquinone biosynthesis hydroxylase [Gammaproteobacteria bacterium]|nr:UbiH/UbiF/VisC/COQ6 family ubiquinone biosynthesis hydroxylase [Gammaproteobacteria bacterium]
MSSDNFDIVIAGAGMVGASAAYALAENGFRVALLETMPPQGDDRPERDYDLRVSAISPRSRAILEGLGIWQQLEQERICSYEKMFIWHQHGSASVGFDAVDLARDNLGAIVENRLLQHTLHRACEKQSRIEWFMPDSVEELLVNNATGVELRLGSGTCLSAGLLIAADGRGSPTRSLAGIDARRGQYQQTAFVANVDTEIPHRHTAWQRFLATGPLAFLPLANGQSSIVWSCDDNFAQQLSAADDTEFGEALAQAFEYRLGAVTGCSARMSFPLGWHSCERWLRDSVLLIGDAAHGVHPLAGQGVNLGFSDVDLLAKLVTEKSQLTRQTQLRRYERQRKSETWVATMSFSGLKWVYGLQQKPLTGLRNLGMRVIEETPWVKRAMMQKATQNFA